LPHATQSMEIKIMTTHQSRSFTTMLTQHYPMFDRLPDPIRNEVLGAFKKTSNGEKPL